MLDIDNVINDFNEKELEKKIKEEYNKKLNEDTTCYDIDNDKTWLTSIDSCIGYPIMKEQDVVEKVVIKKSDLLKALLSNEEEIELLVKVIGRDCDSTGRPIPREF